MRRGPRRPVTGVPCAAAAASVGPASEGRGDSCRLATAGPRGEPRPPTAGHPGRSFPRNCSRPALACSRSGPSGPARRRCALEAVENVVTSRGPVARGPVADIAALRLAAGPVMAEDLWHAERFVHGPTPDLRTAWCVANDRDVPPTGPLRSRTVALFPANGHSARLPRMVIPALHREVWPG